MARFNPACLLAANGEQVEFAAAEGLGLPVDVIDQADHPVGCRLGPRILSQNIDVTPIVMTIEMRDKVNLALASHEIPHTHRLAQAFEIGIDCCDKVAKRLVMAVNQREGTAPQAILLSCGHVMHARWREQVLVANGKIEQPRRFFLAQKPVDDADRQ